MTLQSLLRLCIISKSHFTRPINRLNPCPIKPITVLFEPIRHAGHAKWQNIRSTKQAGDAAKSKLIARYVMQVKRAIIAGNRQIDPKLNKKLGDVLNEANRFNVPKATLERAIQRSLNIKVFNVNLEIQGPGGSSIIALCETENIGALKREVKKILKKWDSAIMPDDSLINMFRSQGFVRTAVKTSDQRDIDQDFAEEAAIMANAEEVELEVFDGDDGSESSKNWVFRVDAQSLNQCKGALERLGFEVTSHELELVPYREIDFGEEIYEKVHELVASLREIDQVVDVYHNVASLKG